VRRIFSSLGSLLGIVALIVLVMALALIFRSWGGETVAWQQPPASTPVPSIGNVRMSDAPGGPAVINFPSRTSSVYLIFEYAQVQDTPIAVRTYDNVGNVLFEQTESYSGEGVESIGMVSSAGAFADGRYVTNVYVGSELFVVKTLMWAVGEELPTPAPTATFLVPGTPTAVSTPRPLPTLPGPLPEGLKLVYEETDHTRTISTLWIASVHNLEARKQVCIIGPHKEGWSAGAMLSPDGTRIAYTIILPGASERSARTAGSELWVIDVNGAHQRKLTERVGFLVAWSPDSASIIYGRLVPLEKPKDPNVPLRTEWYLIAADGAREELLLSDDTLYGITSLGYSPDGKSFYYLARPLQGPREIWAIDMVSRAARRETVINVEGQWHVLSVSPDRTHLLLSRTMSREPTITYELIIFSLDGREMTTILSGARGDRLGDHPLNWYSAFWMPDGRHLLIRPPTPQGEVVQMELLDLQSGEKQTIFTGPIAEEEFFAAEFPSPDGQWLIATKYPGAEVYIMPVQGGEIRPIPAARSSHWVQPIGWITGELPVNEVSP